jgi:hypothetical protein
MDCPVKPDKDHFKKYLLAGLIVLHLRASPQNRIIILAGFCIDCFDMNTKRMIVCFN